MRCLVLADTFPSSLDPWRGPYNRRQIECLAKFCRVTAIDPIPWPQMLRGPRFWELASAPDRVLEGMLVHHPIFWYVPVAGRGRSWRGVLSAAERALKKVRDGHYDIVLATFAYPHGAAARELAQRRGVPYLIKARGSDLHSLPPRGARRERTIEAVRDAAGVVAVSRNLAEIALDLGARHDRVQVLPNGVDADAFPILDRAQARRELGIPQGGRIILFVGSLLPVKGIDVLMEAFRIVRSRDSSSSDAQLLIAGDGPERRSIERFTAREQMGESVKLLGHAPRERVALLTNAAEILVLPSRNEGCPNVVLEALSCGTPVVASRVGAAPELLDETCGILVSPNDPAALAAAIERALATAWRRPALRQRVQEMSWEANARRLHAILQAAAGKRGTGRTGE